MEEDRGAVAHAGAGVKALGSEEAMLGLGSPNSLAQMLRLHSLVMRPDETAYLEVGRRARGFRLYFDVCVGGVKKLDRGSELAVAVAMAGFLLRTGVDVLGVTASENKVVRDTYDRERLSSGRCVGCSSALQLLVQANGEDKETYLVWVEVGLGFLPWRWQA